MQLNLMRTKLHRATVTHADLHYEGSISIDSDLLEASGILPYEKVDILNINNGQRFTTYVIEAEKGSGEIKINGAAARLVHVGDLVIVVAYGLMDIKEARNFKPKVILLDCNNKIKNI